MRCSSRMTQIANSSTSMKSGSMRNATREALYRRRCVADEQLAFPLHASIGVPATDRSELEQAAGYREIAPGAAFDAP
jgi:hypothetical protein